MATTTMYNKYSDKFLGSRVEMVEFDGWGMPGWTGIVTDADKFTVVVKWDNGKRLSHSKNNLRMIAIQDGPNFAFKMYKFGKSRGK